MTLLVRSWNVFHGRTYPPGRRAHLKDAIELATGDAPDVVCLQELPLWSLARLEHWSGMSSFGAPARRGIRLIGRHLTDLHHAVLRSSVTGQANGVLVTRERQATDCGRLRLSESRIAEPRVCQAVRVTADGDDTVLVVNVHCSHHGGGAPAAVELSRTIEFADELSRPGEPVVVAGDLNLSSQSTALQELTGRGGFSAAGPGIDHILVRGAPSSPLTVWPLERRTVNGRVLSDHPPVELYVDDLRPS